jgi:hypothetical protein
MSNFVQTPSVGQGILPHQATGGTTLPACGGIGRETIWQSVQSYMIRRTSTQQMHQPGSRLMRIQGASFSILLNGMND